MEELLTMVEPVQGVLLFVVDGEIELAEAGDGQIGGHTVRVYSVGHPRI
jgi:hypothetical protein